VSLRNIGVICAVLLLLVVVNGLWALMSLRIGPAVGALVYALVAFICWWRNEVHPALIAGIVGMALHTVELLQDRSASFVQPDLGFLVANVLIPIPVVYMSWLLIRARRRLDGSR
jgi:hypothetical protein